LGEAAERPVDRSSGQPAAFGFVKHAPRYRPSPEGL
jgi:hypothetical protein